MALSLYDEFFSVVGALNDARVPYAVCGGMAVLLHTQPRFTKDIDIFLCAAMDSIGYRQWAPPWTFRSSGLTLHRFLRFQDEDFMMVDVLIGQGPAHQRMVDKASRHDTPRGPVRLVQKQDLITLKSARNSLLDQVDIAALKNDPGAKISVGSEQPVGLRQQDGLAAQDAPVSAGPARHRKLAGKSPKATRQKTRRRQS